RQYARVDECRHAPARVADTERGEPRLQGDPLEARRADPRDPRGADQAGRPRGPARRGAGAARAGISQAALGSRGHRGSPTMMSSTLTERSRTCDVLVRAVNFAPGLAGI